jgi:hypothetical protein
MSKNKARSINNIIASLPFTSDIKKKLFDLTVGLLKRTIQLDNAIDEFRKLQFVLDHPMKQSSYETILDEAEINLNNFLDNLWDIIDEEYVTNLNEITLSIRSLFNNLFFIIREQEKRNCKLSEDIEKLTKEMATLKMSEAELLLGSVATQLVIKCCHYLEMNEPVHISKFRTEAMLNSHENIEELKVFLTREGYDWNDLRIVIQMLTHERLRTAHPSDTNTTVENLQAAINKIYPNINSNDRRKAETGLSILYLLAQKLNETLFLSLED